MRFYYTAFLVSMSQGASAMKTLEEVYGPLPPVNEVLPWSQRPGGQSNRDDVIHSEAYRAMRTPDNCSYPIEVVILQDCTASFEDDIVMMDRQIELMTTALDATHPHSSFGLISFRDKPQWSLGSPSDYCHRFESRLSENVTRLQDAYKRLNAVGGGDPAENQYGAIVAAARTSVAGWSYNPLVTRLIVLVTDAYPHFADDGMNDYEMGDFAFNDDAYADQEHRCVDEYYPSPSDVRDALILRKAYLAQLVFGSDWNDSLVRRSWDWLNRFIGQTSHFLEPLAEDSSNFWDALARIVASIEGTECQDLRSTTSTSTTQSTPTTSVPSTFDSPSSSRTTLVPTSQSFSSTTPSTQSTRLPTTSSAISSTLKSTAATIIEPSTPSTTPLSTTTPSTPISTTPPSTIPKSSTPPSTVPISSTPPSTAPISTTTPSGTPVYSTSSTAPLSSTSSSEQATVCECCEGCHCACDEVVIRVAHRPQLLQLIIENDI